MTTYEKLQLELPRNPKTWLITGVAGFIGSNLLETLLKLDQKVVGIDNFETGFKKNLHEVESLVKAKQWNRFSFYEGDINEITDCELVCKDVDYVLHQAALGSVPRSIKSPIETNKTNINGFLNVLVSSKNAGVKRFVYAASSSTYGDHQSLPKLEDNIGKPLSPYAVTKYVNELYADVFSRVYGIESVGLRYFNIFGKRQDPNGAYAAVMPKWISSMINNQKVFINGNGETSRDFTYIENAIQANLLAAATQNNNAVNQVYNVAVGERISLNQLYDLFYELLAPRFDYLNVKNVEYRDFREGDVLHSLADISKIQGLLGYAATHKVQEGIAESIEWYLEKLKIS